MSVCNLFGGLKEEERGRRERKETGKRKKRVYNRSIKLKREQRAIKIIKTRIGREKKEGKKKGGIENKTSWCKTKIQYMYALFCNQHKNIIPRFDLLLLLLFLFLLLLFLFYFFFFFLILFRFFI